MRRCRNCHTHSGERSTIQIEQHKECFTQWKQKWEMNNKHWRKDYYLRNQFGISIEEYNKLFISQKGCCDICGLHQNKVKQALCVDHNHITKEVRGLLCKRCNLM